MTTATLTVTLELDDCAPEILEARLKEIANGTIRANVEFDWSDSGDGTAWGGYEGPLVRSVTIAHNGVEIKGH